MTREHIIAFFVILFILISILVPQFVYKMPFPSAGDDGAQYLTILENKEPVRNFGIMPLQWLQDIGLSPINSLKLLYYSIIVVSTLMVWLFIRQFGLKTAVIGTVLVMLGNWGIWKLWFDGSVLSIGGLLIFNLGAYLSLIKLDKTKKHYWALIFLAFLIGGVLWHKYTGMYLLGTVLLYSILNKKWDILALSSVGLVIGGLIWVDDNDLINRTMLNISLINIIAFLAFLTGLGYLWIKARHFYFMIPNEYRILTTLLIILAFGFWLSFIIPNPYRYRINLDFITVLLIFASLLISKAISYIPDFNILFQDRLIKIPCQIIAIFIFLSFILVNNSDKWNSDYSAIRYDDLPLIQQVNSLANKHDNLVLATTWGESPWIMRYFIDRRIQLTTDIDKADIILYRNIKRVYNEEKGAQTDYDLKAKTFDHIEFLKASRQNE